MEREARSTGCLLYTSIKQLAKHPQIVVATPGRLMDHYNRKTLRLDKVQTVVLDEADRMLDMGFFDDVTKIIERVKNRKNLGLFSATISQEVMTVSWMYQRDEVEITVPADVENRPDITQYSITCPPLEKVDMAIRLIRTLALERTIIFCNTKVMCQRPVSYTHLDVYKRQAGADGREFLRVQRKSLEHVVIIVARLQVHQTRARGIRKIGRVHAAREPVNEIVLALQEPCLLYTSQCWKNLRWIIQRNKIKIY